MDERAAKSKALWREAVGYEPPSGDDIDKAISLYKEALETDPRNILACIALGRIHAFTLDDLEKGEDYCRRGYEIEDTPCEIRTPAIGVSDVLEENADDLNNTMMGIRMLQDRYEEAEEYLAKMKRYFDKYQKGHYRTAFKTYNKMKTGLEDIARHRTGTSKTLDPNKWEEALLVSEYAKINIKCGGRPRILEGDKYALKCRGCGSVTPFPPCANCRAVSWAAGASTDGVPGLFCSECAKGFVRWSCSSCDLDNSVDRTLAKKKSCFIATAAFGSPLAAEVGILSDFRDNTLNRTRLGRALITLYYWLGPPAAAIIKRHELCRAATRLLLRSLMRITRALGPTDQ